MAWLIRVAYHLSALGNAVVGVVIAGLCLAIGWPWVALAMLLIAACWAAADILARHRQRP